MADWAKKQLSKLGVYKSSKRLLPARPSTSPPVQEIVLAADLKCFGCRKRVANVFASIDGMESMVVHVVEKKVAFTGNSATRDSSKTLKLLLSSAA